MNKVTLSNFVIASNLTFISSGLYAILLVSNLSNYSDPLWIIPATAIVILYISIGYLVRRGINWTRYVLLLFAFSGILFGLPEILFHFSSNPMRNVINIVQILVQVCATLFVFVSPIQHRR